MSDSVKLVITRKRDNPLFDAEVERQAHRNPDHWNNRDHVCQAEFLETEALTVELTEEQFRVVKKAVMEVM